MQKLLVATMYHFAYLPDPAGLRERLLLLCEGRGVIGTILLAEEGINGTIAGRPIAVHDIVEFLKAAPRFADLVVKESSADAPPFGKLNIRVKQEIVTMGAPGIDPAEETGTRVKPEDWNELISDPETVVIDNRNNYETSIGSFRGAVDPQTESFREMPGWLDRELDWKKQPKVAMYCTGGIRCEKSTAYLLQKGYRKVFQLDGGILKYLETVPAEESLWEGECFVFDRRVALAHGLTPGSQELCSGCGWPVSREGVEASPDREVPDCARCKASLPSGA